jgi:hypothetical protein
MPPMFESPDSTLDVGSQGVCLLLGLGAIGILVLLEVVCLGRRRCAAIGRPRQRVQYPVADSDA